MSSAHGTPTDRSCVHVRPLDQPSPRTAPTRSTLCRVAGDAIVLMNDDSRDSHSAEAVITIMRQAGRLVDEHAVARMTPMQCRVHGYRLAALLRMNHDGASQHLADELLDCIGAHAARGRATAR
jgi:hypothetical protein